MQPLTREQRSAVLKLARAYDAFNKARVDPPWPNAVLDWGRLLIEAQEETGVVLIDAPYVASVIHQFGKA